MIEKACRKAVGALLRRVPLAHWRAKGVDFDDLMQMARFHAWLALKDPAFQKSRLPALLKWRLLDVARDVFKRRKTHINELPREDFETFSTERRDASVLTVVMPDGTRVRFDVAALDSAIRRALGACSEKCAAIARMHFFDDVLLKECGARFGVSESMASVYAARFCKRLEEILRGLL